MKNQLDPSLLVSGKVHAKVLPLLKSCFEWQKLIALFFVPSCWNCGLWLKDSIHKFYLCSACFEALPWQKTALPLTQSLQNNPDNHLDGIWSALVYQDSLIGWLWGFKYYRQDNLASMLGWLLAQATPKFFSTSYFHLVIPVPLHAKRLAWRGYNQSQLLAKCWLNHLSEKRSKQPVINNQLLQRIKETQTQMQLSLAERTANVCDAFAPTSRDANLENKRILLLDDMFTSGNTLNACAKVLKSLGAKEVWGLALAWRP